MINEEISKLKDLIDSDGDTTMTTNQLQKLLGATGDDYYVRLVAEIALRRLATYEAVVASLSETLKSQPEGHWTL